MIYNAILFTTTERTLPIKNIEKFNKLIKLSLTLSRLTKNITLPLNICSSISVDKPTIGNIHYYNNNET